MREVLGCRRGRAASGKVPQTGLHFAWKSTPGDLGNPHGENRGKADPLYREPPWARGSGPKVLESLEFLDRLVHRLEQRLDLVHLEAGKGHPDVVRPGGDQANSVLVE